MPSIEVLLRCAAAEASELQMLTRGQMLIDDQHHSVSSTTQSSGAKLSVSSSRRST